MLRLASSFIASAVLVFLGAGLLGAAVYPATPELKVIGTVTIHAHPHQVASQAPHGL